MFDFGQTDGLTDRGMDVQMDGDIVLNLEIKYTAGGGVAQAEEHQILFT